MPGMRKSRLQRTVQSVNHNMPSKPLIQREKPLMNTLNGCCSVVCEDTMYRYVCAIVQMLVIKNMMSGKMVPADQEEVPFELSTSSRELHVSIERKSLGLENVLKKSFKSAMVSGI